MIKARNYVFNLPAHYVFLRLKNYAVTPYLLICSVLLIGLIIWKGEWGGAGYVMLGAVALICWFQARATEQSLVCAQQRIAELRRQKAIIKARNKKHTISLHQLQLQEMRHMYHFADLGQNGITLLHDLANHVTALKLEIEDKPHTQAMLPTRRIVQRLGDIVDATRERLRGGTQQQTFSLPNKIGEVVAFLWTKAAKAQVTLSWQAPGQSWNYRGDPASLCQVVAILVSNAIDAYGTARKTAGGEARRVRVVLNQDEASYIIQVSDWGGGISRTRRRYLFQPCHGTKKRTGLGIGLYIAKQTIEMQFSGTIELAPADDHTEFIVTLPRDPAVARQPFC